MTVKLYGVLSRWMSVRSIVSKCENDEIVRGKIFDRIGKPRDWTVTGHTPPGPAPKDPIQRREKNGGGKHDTKSNHDVVRPDAGCAGVDNGRSSG
jgi:hypothetical protein